MKFWSIQLINQGFQNSINWHFSVLTFCALCTLCGLTSFGLLLKNSDFPQKTQFPLKTQGFLKNSSKIFRKTQAKYFEKLKKLESPLTSFANDTNKKTFSASKWPKVKQHKPQEKRVAYKKNPYVTLKLLETCLLCWPNWSVQFQASQLPVLRWKGCLVLLDALSPSLKHGFRTIW